MNLTPEQKDAIAITGAKIAIIEAINNIPRPELETNAGALVYDMMIKSMQNAIGGR